MTEERKPFWVKCPACSHHWVAAYTPLSVETFAKLIQCAACPMCGQADGITFASGGHAPPQPDVEYTARLASWFSSNDTGISSKAIAAHMSGGNVDRWGWGHPSDPDDLGRCLRLLELFPEWKPRIGEMAKHGPGWAGLVARWDEIAESMRDEVGIGDGYRNDPTFECTFDKRGHLRSAKRKSAA